MAERQAEPARQAQPGAATAARRRLGRVRGLVGEQQQKGGARARSGEASAGHPGRRLDAVSAGAGRRGRAAAVRLQAREARRQ